MLWGLDGWLSLCNAGPSTGGKRWFQRVSVVLPTSLMDPLFFVSILLATNCSSQAYRSGDTTARFSTQKTGEKRAGECCCGVPLWRMSQYQTSEAKSAWDIAIAEIIMGMERQ